MSDLEKLNNALRLLNNIMVPNFLLESVAIPIYNAAVDVREVIQSMQKNQMQNSISSDVQGNKIEEIADVEESKE